MSNPISGRGTLKIDRRTDRIVLDIMYNEKCLACGGEVKPAYRQESHDCWGKDESYWVPPTCKRCGADQSILKELKNKK